MSVVENYVAGLASALRGPRRVKADLLAEARHSLDDACEAYLDEGLPADSAQRRAVTEFGSLAEVVPGYQAELAVAQGRRTAVMFAVGLVALRFVAPLAWGGGLDHGGTPGVFFGYLAGAGVVAALAAWLLLGWGSRYAPDGARVTRLLGRGALGFLGLHGVVGLAVCLWSLTRVPAALGWPPLWLGMLAMNAMFGCAVAFAWRCVALSRTAPLAGG